MDTGDQGTIFFPALTAYTFRQLTGCLEWEHSTWLGYEKTSTLLREDDAYEHRRRREEDGCSFSWTLKWSECEQPSQTHTFEHLVPG